MVDTPASLQFAKNFRNQARPVREEKLLGLDNLNSQCSPDFQEAMRESKTELPYTPADCTDLCAVTDMVRISSRRCPKMLELNAPLHHNFLGYEYKNMVVTVQ